MAWVWTRIASPGRMGRVDCCGPPTMGDLTMRRILTLAVLILCGLRGCDRTDEPTNDEREQQGEGKPVGAPSGPAKTPRAVIQRLASSLQDGRRQAFLSCFVGTPEEMAGPRALYVFSQAGIAFRRDFIKAYGQEGWEKFQNEDPGGANAKLDLVPTDVSDIRIEVQGRQARAINPDGGKPLPLVAVEGGWAIPAAKMLPPGAEPAKLEAMMEKMAAAISKYRKAIGREGVTVSDIDFELGRALMKIMTGMEIDAPHRFDIDKM